MKLGDFVREERLNRGMTQNEFADAVGLSYVSINSLENGNQCGIKIIKKLSEYLDVSIPQLRAMLDENNK